METHKLEKYFNVQAYKYNGKLYRQWNGVRIIDDKKNYLVAYMNKKTRVQEKKTHRWNIKSNTLWFFHKYNFFNAIVTIEGNKNYIYVNLASPFFMEDDTIKYIDFDLDIKVYHGKEINIIDKNEFFMNAKKMDYSKKLTKLIFEELKKIVDLYYSSEFIFDNKFLSKYIKKIKIINSKKSF
ncbi:DUF402 domain-containing protein [Mesomycoplasma neurolyticum]|uniref:Protein of uncharacterized function (DUF402) n=1 Tax=Mesomycoplasma neurolyticum TaxID=2120 RepID=A0A449A6N6_9BACT|nr:DUF402 domain-containing protein [Mesomycoplasma neurolyticum]VEU59765.1 Protein of uncharacterised function (DUF402) [Mesomycoplasma neurolyticum]VEU59904.1 Protein of uncharacterised function (DUF402) [Mesomycoplasma neurolyticum]